VRDILIPTALATLAVLAAGCSSSAAPGHGPYPAPHATLPVIQTSGGPVLSSPQVVPVFFSSDPLRPQVESFLAQLANSSYWPAVTREYGVGPLGVSPSVVVADPPPATIADSDIQTWLASYAWPPGVPPPGSDLGHVYAIFYPESTVVSDSGNHASCIEYYGYHAEAIASPGSAVSRFVYVVVARCASGALAAIDGVTSTASHELVEAATDPLPSSAPAFTGADNDHLAWNYGFTGPAEIGDMCLSRDREHANARLVGSFVVQRIWSDQAAYTGLDPCVPPAPTPYFAAAPELDQTVEIVSGGVQATKGVRIAVGESATVSVDLFSTAPVPDWYVAAEEAPPNSFLLASPPDKTLAFSWDTPWGNNGDVLHLTITRLASATAGASVFEIYSSNTAPASDPLDPAQRNWNTWAGFAGQ
jgi:hypothetical protein